MTILITGRSGSGKTTLARSLVRSLDADGVSYLHQDSYYKDQGHLSYEERGKINYDHPNCIEKNLLIQHLKKLQNREDINKPIYNFSTHTRDNNTEKVKAREVIIADGIHLLHFEEIRKLSDLNIFVDTDQDICLIRRILRDTKERGRSVESVLNQYLDTVRPMQKLYVDPCIVYADYIVKGEDMKSTIIDLLNIIKSKTET